MDTDDTSTPGFAIMNFPRQRSAVAARVHGLDASERRHDLDGQPYGATIAGSLDALADGLASIEAQVDVSEATLDPDEADELRHEVAHAGARLIEARYSSEPNEELLQSLRESLVRLNDELQGAQLRNEADAAEIRRLRREAKTLTAELHEARKGRAIDRAQMAALEAQITRFEGAATAAAETARVASASEVEGLRDEMLDLQMALQDMQSRMITLHNENEELKVEGDLARAQLSDTEAMLRATHSELVRTRGRASDAERRVEALRTALEERANAGADQAAELERLREAAGTSAAAHAAVEAELAEQREENELMEQWLNGALSRYAELLIRVNDLESMVSAATRAVA